MSSPESTTTAEPDASGVIALQVLDRFDSRRSSRLVSA